MNSRFLAFNSGCMIVPRMKREDLIFLKKAKNKSYHISKSIGYQAICKAFYISSFI